MYVFNDIVNCFKNLEYIFGDFKGLFVFNGENFINCLVVKLCFKLIVVVVYL